MKVYAADHGLVKAREGINIRMEGVVLETHPAVSKYPEAFRAVGTVDDAGAAYIAMLGDSATLKLLWERITPLGMDAATTPPSGAGPRALTGPRAGDDGLTLPELRTALRTALSDPLQPWPPRQDEITGYTARRVRQVLRAESTTWRAELARAESEAGKG